MNERSISKAKIAFRKRKKIFFLEKILPDAKLKRLVKRAVRKTAVPEDSESRMLNFIKETIVR